MAQALPVIGMITSGVGAVVSAVSGMQAGAYNAAVAERNATIAEKNRIEAIAASQREAQDAGLSAQKEIGSLEAALSSSGFDMNSGTNLLRRRSLRTLSRQDQTRAREDGNTQGDAFGQQGADFRSSASQERKSGRFALFAGVANGVSSILSEANALRKARAVTA